MSLTRAPFPSGYGVALVSLRQSVETLSDRAGARLESWEEAGLGACRGFVFSPVSGRLFTLTEHDHIRRRLGASDPVVEVDAQVAADLGFSLLLEEMLSALGLGQEDVSWRPDDLAGWAAEARSLLTL